MTLLESNISLIKSLCKKHKVKKLFAFGSVLTDRFSENSDVDLVVDFEDVDLADYADNYFNLKESLMRILGRNVDLLEDKGIRNPILRRNIDRTKLLIYG